MYTLPIQFDKEADGRWIAEIGDLPGVSAYGTTKEEAVAKVEALALRVIAERIELGEIAPSFNISFTTL